MRIHIAGAIAAAVLASSSAAVAADLTTGTIAEVPDWTGFYVGVHGGIAAGDFNYPFSYEAFNCCGETARSLGSVDGEIGLDGGGLFGGVYVGGDYQISPSFLVGLVADISATNYDGKASFSIDGFSVEAGSELEWFATARGRIGFIWDDFLFFATGGGAWGDIESSISGSGFDTISKTTSHFGYAVGGGFEYRVTRNIRVKTEYLYINLGDENLLNLEDCDTLSADVETDFHTVKAGVSFHF